MTSNLIAYSLQVAIVIAAGAILPKAFRLKAPRPRLLYLQALLLACLALPLIQPWRQPEALSGPSARAAAGPAASADALPQASRFPLADVAAGVLVSGALIRSLWLFLGLARLRRYRRRARPLRDGVLPADVRLSEEIAGPVTFGIRRPTILVPARFLELAPPARQAILCHELLHVRRHDWGFTVAEEAVRCVLWFHPAVCWLLGRIQLAREEVVDQAVVEHTREPGQYLEALIAVAALRLDGGFAPAPLFLKKRHLRERVASIVKGSQMSRRNLLLSSFAAFSCLPVLVGLAAWQFPLNAAPREVRDGVGVEVKQGPWKLLHRAGVYYPVEAREKGISGDVVASVSVNDKGEVTDARILSGPLELRKAVLEPVLSWHFAVEPAPPPSFEITVRFDASQAPPTAGPERVRVSGEVQQAELVNKVMPRYPAEAKQAGIEGTVRMEVVIGADGKVLRTEVISGPPLLVPAALEAVRQWTYKPTLLNGQPVEVITQVDVNFRLGA